MNGKVSGGKGGAVIEREKEARGGKVKCNYGFGGKVQQQKPTKKKITLM